MRASRTASDFPHCLYTIRQTSPARPGLRRRMVTYVYICERCSGGKGQFTFEVTYPNLGEAEAAPMPECPKCGEGGGVTRFYGHAIYGPRKSALSDHQGGQYIPLRQGQEKGVLSVGMRLNPEIMAEVSKRIRKMAQDAGVELAERALDMIPDHADGGDHAGAAPADMPAQPAPEQGDPISDVLGLRPGTVDRALFDIRQKKLIEDLRSGIPFSGFFMPLTGSSSN